MNVFMDYTGEKFNELCEYIENEKPKFIFYDNSHECFVSWIGISVNEKKISEFFITPELKKLNEILLKNQTIFYLVLGCNDSVLYDKLSNNLSKNFVILYYPIGLLGLEYEYLSKNINNIALHPNIKTVEDLQIDNNFNKLFVCYNNKPTHHRCLMIDELAKHDLLKDGLFSWNQYSQNFKFKYWKESIVKIDDFEYITNNEFRSNLLKTKCFISLTTETEVNLNFVTEKTFRQILLKQPFICLAAPNHHELLKSFGFLLYDEIIDYSFDYEENLQKRVEGIVDNLLNIKNNDYTILYKKIEHKLEYNKKRALEIINGGLFIPKILSEFCDKYITEKNITYDSDNKLRVFNNVSYHQFFLNSNLNVWKSFIKSLREKFYDYTPKITSKTNYYAVIIEPRNLDELEIMMKSTMYYLNETNSNIKWGLQIFHGTENMEFVKQITKDWGEIEYVNMNINNLSHEEHSKYMETLEFWDKVKGEKVLIFQTDSTLIRHGIDEFLKYDYVGAPWRKPKENQIVGNGGLSLRNVSIMRDICKKYQPTELILEDIFFVKHMNGNNVADFETAKNFSMEDVYSENPLGVHKPIKHIQDELLRKVLFKNKEI